MTASPPRAALDMLCFLPARDFELSQRFYLELGFERAWADGKLARFQIDGCAFMLQDFYVKAHAHNCMMHLRVACLDDWWRHVTALDLGRRYGCHSEPPAQRQWGMRDFTLGDPSGVLWRIAENNNPAS